jgi:hypothetical protein
LFLLKRRQEFIGLFSDYMVTLSVPEALGIVHPILSREIVHDLVSS